LFGRLGWPQVPSELARKISTPQGSDLRNVCPLSSRYTELYIHVTVLHRNRFLFNNQAEALIKQIYSVIKLYMFRASSLSIVRSSLLYIRQW
jgi:hypothetical protein